MSQKEAASRIWTLVFLCRIIRLLLFPSFFVVRAWMARWFFWQSSFCWVLIVWWPSRACATHSFCTYVYVREHKVNWASIPGSVRDSTYGRKSWCLLSRAYLLCPRNKTLQPVTQLLPLLRLPPGGASEVVTRNSALRLCTLEHAVAHKITPIQKIALTYPQIIHLQAHSNNIQQIHGCWTHTYRQTHTKRVCERNSVMRCGLSGDRKGRRVRYSQLVPSTHNLSHHCLIIVPPLSLHCPTRQISLFEFNLAQIYVHIHMNTCTYLLT